MIRKEDVEIEISHYIGVWKQQTETAPDIISKITTACKNKNITDCSIDMRKEMREQVIKVRGREIPFIEVHLNNDERTVREICDGILDLKIPCYRGDVVLSLPNESLIYKIFIVLMVPSNSEKRGNGIHVVRNFIDEQCNIVFPTASISTNPQKAFFKDLKLQIPTTAAEVQEKLRENLERLFGRFDSPHAMAYGTKQMSFMARASLIYPAMMIWRDGSVPPSIREIIPAVSFLRDGCLQYMEVNDVDRLGLLEFLTEANEQSILSEGHEEKDPNFIDLIGDAIRPRSNEERAKALLSVEKQINNSKYRNENIEVVQLDRDSIVFKMNRPTTPSRTAEDPRRPNVQVTGRSSEETEENDKRRVHRRT